MRENTISNIEIGNDFNSFDYKALLNLVVRYWYLFFISIICCIIVAKVYLRYTHSTYQVKSNLLIKDEKRKLGAEQFIEGMELLSTSNNIQNEIEIVRSFDNVKKALTELNFEVSYYVKGNIKEGELYKCSPFIVTLDTSYEQLRGVPYHIKLLTDSTFSIETSRGQEAPEVVSQCKFGEACRSDIYRFIVYKSEEFSFNQGSDYYFIINDLENLTHVYVSKLSIELSHKNSSLLVLQSQGPVIQKEVDFINKVGEVYIQRGLEEKNQIAINTIRFIDAQLSQITDSLHGAEMKLERFRSSEKIMNLSSSADKAFEHLDQLENQKAELIVKDRYYHYLLDYVKYNYDLKELIAPSTMGIDDPLLNKLIQDLHLLVSERTSLGFSTKEKNPTYNIVELNIENTKKALIENLKTILQASKIAIQDNEQRLNKIHGIINKLPEKERSLVNIQRRFTLNDNIYNYLMEKRIEAGIAKAANTADNKVINKALFSGATAIFPKPIKTYSIGFMIGLFIPLLFILLKVYFNDTVKSKEIIQQYTNAPLIGSIAHYIGKSLTPVVDTPKSIISESIRSVRINLQYLAAGKKNKIIGITSSISGEGKTFFSSNLAASIAQSGAKVILIGADMRKPKIHENFLMDNSKGLSTYFIKKATIEDIIRKTSIPNLDIITSGPIPPNPAELLETQLSENLINWLEEKYEYIIVDGTPVALVADYYLLSKYIDANLYLVRQNYTKKSLLKEIQSINADKKLKNMFIIFNDAKNEFGYGYGYNSYGYGGYGYTEENSTSLWNKFRNAFKGVNQNNSSKT